MNEIIQELKANSTNGKENFCYISENKLNAMKALSKKEKEEYDKLQENFNKLLGKYNEEHANVLNYQQIITEREKNYLKINKEKDKKIKELKEELSAYKSKQIDIFEV